MALIVICDEPAGLLRQIRRGILDGQIVTWSFDDDGDFTHATPQWRNQAWMRPRPGYDRLVFTILSPQNVQLTREVYAIYHGRLTEMLLAHFDNLFRSAAATALPTPDDRVQ